MRRKIVIKPRPATLVVIEFGASWPRWLHPNLSGDLAVVAQHYEGPPTDLVTQVASRVTRLTGMGWEVEAIVLVANERHDVEAVAARSVLARGLMAHLRSAGGVHFTLSLDDSFGRRSAQSLNYLAAGLEPMANACGVLLGVRVGEREPLYSRPLLSRPASSKVASAS
ncbi:MAG TPA: hypothetical protein VM686_17470 [Polyangiaceae bacterium]|jgi:hypothetical protein|nr:hypothetical protein [Polyangiaceae bacterium]